MLIALFKLHFLWPFLRLAFVFRVRRHVASLLRTVAFAWPSLGRPWETPDRLRPAASWGAESVNEIRDLCAPPPDRARSRRSNCSGGGGVRAHLSRPQSWRRESCASVWARLRPRMDSDALLAPWRLFGLRANFSSTTRTKTCCLWTRSSPDQWVCLYFEGWMANSLNLVNAHTKKKRILYIYIYFNYVAKKLQSLLSFWWI